MWLEEQIADFVVSITYESLPHKVVEITKMQILDFLGVALAGAETPGAKEMKNILVSLGGKGEATVWGSNVKLPSPNAAQINAIMGHALDFDDVHEIAVMHPGVITIPVATALCEKMHRSGKDLLTAIAVGVDLACRLAMAPTPGKRAVATGWHLTTLFGYIVAAAVAAKILMLDLEKTVNAMGIAYHLCSGNGQCVKDGALTKRLGPGFAVHDGILSAFLAQEGVTGARRFLEGEWGLYRLYFGGDYSREVITQDLGKSFTNTRVNFKPYPCCRGVHPAIDAALKIKNTYGVKPEEIQEVTLIVSEGHYALLCSPEESKRFPRNAVDAQFSIPWGVAVALAKGNVTFESFTEAATRDRSVLSITERTKIQVDASLNRKGDLSVEPTRVIVNTKGRILEEVVEAPLGSSENPMTFEDCIKKFRSCASSLSDELLDRVINGVAELEKWESVGSFTSLLSR